MKIRRYAAAGMAAAAALALVAAAPASAAPGMTRGTTTVVLNPGVVGTLLDLGVSAEAPGTLTTPGGNVAVSFPIVGQIKGGKVSHTGGLDFSNVTGGYGTNVSVSHFIIDTNTGVLTGQATVDGMDVGTIPVFDLGKTQAIDGAPTCTGIPAGLYLDDAAAMALGIDNTTPVFIGDACVAPTDKVKMV